MTRPRIPIYNPATTQLEMTPTFPRTVVHACGSGGGDYLTIQAAIDSISDATAIKQYEVVVAPGLYAGFTPKDYVHVTAASPINRSVIVAGATTLVSATLTAGAKCGISGITFALTPTTDNQSCVDVTGDFTFTGCLFVADLTADVICTVVKLNSTGITIMGLSGVYITTGTGSTKNIIGIETNGSGNISMYSYSIQLYANSTAGTHSLLKEIGTGLRNSDAIIALYNQANAGFGGSVYCWNVTSADSTFGRASMSSQIRLQGAGAGTAYVFGLNSSGGVAEYFHINSSIIVQGFANEYLNNTAAGDTHKIWNASTNKYLTDTGAGLATVILRDLVNTGRISWSTIGATYWSYNTGTRAFTINKRVTGMVHAAPVTAAAGQSVTLTDKAVNYVYMTSAGAIGFTTSPNDGTYEDNLLLFQVWVNGTNYLVAREDHPAKFPMPVSIQQHNTFGPLLQYNTSTLAIVSAANRTIRFSGDNVLLDHGLTTTVSAISPVVWSQLVNGSGSKMALVASAAGIVSVKSNGTDTGVNVANNRYCIFRLGVIKDNINSSAAQFVCYAHDTDYANLSAANTAITSGSVIAFPAELKTLEVAQVGYAIIVANGAGAGTLSQVTTALQVFGAAYVAGGTTTSAGLVTTNTTNFDKILSGTDTSVQAALDTLDDGATKKETGDIAVTSFSAANNQSSAADVTGLLFANASVRAFRASVSVTVIATTSLYEVVYLYGVQRGADWILTATSAGDDSKIVFSITNAGQVQYTSANYAGFTSATLKFRAWALPV